MKIPLFSGEIPMDMLGLLAILICILLAASISRRIQNTIITLPMVYTFFGIILGGLVLDIIPLNPEDHLVELVAELTLVIVLATDASRIDLRGLFRDHNLPTRLLGIGLPLTMIVGAIAAVLIFTNLTFWEAAILGVILAPTDASLGQSVVSNPKVPVRIRQTLNIESGFNDGIALPFLMLAIAMAESEVSLAGPSEFLISVLAQIGLGIAAGLVVGYLGSRFIQWGQNSGWMSRNYQRISSLALILVAYGTTELIGGNGFIAVFCFGLATRIFAGKEETEDIYEYAEIEVTVLMLLTFTLFGAVMLPPAIEKIDPEILLYAILSLTLVRILSVAISMVGAKIRPVTNLFLGWFGPRGIASILYVFIVLESENLPGLELMYSITMFTVLLSIFSHGITAAPLANRYGVRMEWMEKIQEETSETEAVTEMPLRVSSQSQE
jgi:NhaP-type Na+/H+ or K+/H+ antiporter